MDEVGGQVYVAWQCFVVFSCCLGSGKLACFGVVLPGGPSIGGASMITKSPNVPIVSYTGGLAIISHCICPMCNMLVVNGAPFLQALSGRRARQMSTHRPLEPV